MENRADTISAQEMAQQLGVTTQTVYNYIERGFIPSTRQRRGLRSRLVVLRVDFEAALPKLMSGDLDGQGTIDRNIPEDARTPSLAAA